MKTELELLRERLEELVRGWDREAKDCHIGGMNDTATALRSCRDELRRALRGATRDGAKEHL